MAFTGALFLSFCGDNGPGPERRDPAGEAPDGGSSQAGSPDAENPDGGSSQGVGPFASVDAAAPEISSLLNSFGGEGGPEGGAFHTSRSRSAGRSRRHVELQWNHGGFMSYIGPVLRLSDRINQSLENASGGFFESASNILSLKRWAPQTA